MKRIRTFSLLITVLAITFLSALAHADSISITLTETVKSGAGGSIVTFDATLTNLTGSTIFLNGDSSSTSSLFLSVLDNDFLKNAPAFLAAGASTGQIALFSVMIAPGIPIGSYGNNIFTILGGGTGSALNPLGSATFTLNVGTTPEPSTMMMLGAGLIAIGGLKSRFRTTLGRGLRTMRSGPAQPRT
jgi:hypothetical protein